MAEWIGFRRKRSDRFQCGDLAPPPACYARNQLPETDDRGFPADFDVMAHMKFADEVTRRASLAVLADDFGVTEDEARFLDRARTRGWTVEEHITPHEDRSH